MSELQLIERVELIFDPNSMPKKWVDVDRLELAISKMPRREYGTLIEKGTPGLYSRTLIMPKGMVCTSMIHNTHHQFIVSQGMVRVYNTLDDTDLVFQAGDHGITHIGTRRVLYCFEETKWTTFHPTDKIKRGFDLLTEEEKQCIFNDIFLDITQQYENPLLSEFNDGVFF